MVNQRDAYGDSELVRALVGPPDAMDSIVRRALAHMMEGDPGVSTAVLKQRVTQLRQVLWAHLEAYLAAEAVLTARLTRALDERQTADRERKEYRREMLEARADQEVLRGRLEVHRDALERGRAKLAHGDADGAYQILAGVTTRENVEDAHASA